MAQDPFDPYGLWGGSDPFEISAQRLVEAAKSGGWHNDDFVALPEVGAEPSPDHVARRMGLRESEITQGGKLELGWSDAWKGTEIGDFVPFWAGAKDLKEVADLWKSADRIQKEQGTQEDFAAIQQFLEEANADKSFGYWAGSILRDLPAFAGEIWMGLGFARKAAAKVGLKTIKEVLEGTLKRKSYKSAARRVENEAAGMKLAGNLEEAAEHSLMGETFLKEMGVTGWRNVKDAGIDAFYGHAGSEALTSVIGGVSGHGWGGRSQANAYQRAMAASGIHMNRDEAGRLDIAFDYHLQGWLSKMPHGILDGMIEHFTERMGRTIMDMPFINKIKGLQSAQATRYMKKHGLDPLEFADHLDKAGWDGVLEEYFEERLGARMRNVLMVGEDEWMVQFEHEKDPETGKKKRVAGSARMYTEALIPDVNQHIGEMIAFLGPGAAHRGLTKMFGEKAIRGMEGRDPTKSVAKSAQAELLMKKAIFRKKLERIIGEKEMKKYDNQNVNQEDYDKLIDKIRSKPELAEAAADAGVFGFRGGEAAEGSDVYESAKEWVQEVEGVDADVKPMVVPPTTRFQKFMTERLKETVGTEIIWVQGGQKFNREASASFNPATPGVIYMNSGMQEGTSASTGNLLGKMWHEVVHGYDALDDKHKKAYLDSIFDVNEGLTADIWDSYVTQHVLTENPELDPLDKRDLTKAESERLEALKKDWEFGADGKGGPRADGKPSFQQRYGPRYEKQKQMEIRATAVESPAYRDLLTFLVFDNGVKYVEELKDKAPGAIEHIRDWFLEVANNRLGLKGHEAYPTGYEARLRNLIRNLSEVTHEKANAKGIPQSLEIASTFQEAMRILADIDTPMRDAQTLATEAKTAQEERRAIDQRRLQAEEADAAEQAVLFPERQTPLETAEAQAAVEGRELTEIERRLLEEEGRLLDEARPPEVVRTDSVRIPPGRKDMGAAWYDPNENRIYLNEEVARQKYEEKAWTDPKVEGVMPLPEDAFADYEEWEQWLIAHETYHAEQDPARQHPVNAEFENEANAYATAQVQATRRRGQDLAMDAYEEAEAAASDMSDEQLIEAIETSDLAARELGMDPRADPSHQAFIAEEAYREKAAQEKLAERTAELEGMKVPDLSKLAVRMGIPRYENRKKKRKERLVEDILAAEAEGIKPEPERDPFWGAAPIPGTVITEENAEEVDAVDRWEQDLIMGAAPLPPSLREPTRFRPPPVKKAIGAKEVGEALGVPVVDEPETELSPPGERFDALRFYAVTVEEDGQSYLISQVGGHETRHDVVDSLVDYNWIGGEGIRLEAIAEQALPGGSLEGAEEERERVRGELETNERRQEILEEIEEVKRTNKVREAGGLDPLPIPTQFDVRYGEGAQEEVGTMTLEEGELPTTDPGVPYQVTRELGGKRTEDVYIDFLDTVAEVSDRSYPVYEARQLLDLALNARRRQHLAQKEEAEIKEVTEKLNAGTLYHDTGQRDQDGNPIILTGREAADKEYRRIRDAQRKKAPTIRIKDLFNNVVKATTYDTGMLDEEGNPIILTGRAAWESLPWSERRNLLLAALRAADFNPVFDGRANLGPQREDLIGLTKKELDALAKRWGIRPGYKGKNKAETIEHILKHPSGRQLKHDPKQDLTDYNQDRNRLRTAEANFNEAVRKGDTENAVYWEAQIEEITSLWADDAKQIMSLMKRYDEVTVYKGRRNQPTRSPRTLKRYVGATNFRRWAASGLNVDLDPGAGLSEKQAKTFKENLRHKVATGQLTIEDIREIAQRSPGAVDKNGTPILRGLSFGNRIATTGDLAPSRVVAWNLNGDTGASFTEDLEAQPLREIMIFQGSQMPTDITALSGHPNRVGGEKFDDSSLSEAQRAQQGEGRERPTATPISEMPGLEQELGAAEGAFTAEEGVLEEQAVDVGTRSEAYMTPLGQAPTSLEARKEDEAFVQPVLKRVISGGQVGPDRSALEAARSEGYETAGTAPPGFETVEGPRPDLQEFGLVEATPEQTAAYTGGETKYGPRTELNVVNSDGTAIFSDTSREEKPWSGTALTRKLAGRHGKPVIENPTPEEFAKWTRDNNIETVNIAGSRTLTDASPIRAALAAAKRGGMAPSTLVRGPKGHVTGITGGLAHVGVPFQRGRQRTPAATGIPGSAAYERAKAVADARERNYAAHLRPNNVVELEEAEAKRMREFGTDKPPLGLKTWDEFLDHLDKTGAWNEAEERYRTVEELAEFRSREKSFQESTQELDQEIRTLEAELLAAEGAVLEPTEESRARGQAVIAAKAKALKKYQENFKMAIRREAEDKPLQNPTVSDAEFFNAAPLRPTRRDLLKGFGLGAAQSYIDGMAKVGGLIERAMSRPFEFSYIVSGPGTAELRGLQSLVSGSGQSIFAGMRVSSEMSAALEGMDDISDTVKGLRAVAENTGIVKMSFADAQVLRDQGLDVRALDYDEFGPSPVGAEYMTPSERKARSMWNVSVPESDDARQYGLSGITPAQIASDLQSDEWETAISYLPEQVRREFFLRNPDKIDTYLKKNYDYSPEEWKARFEGQSIWEMPPEERFAWYLDKLEGEAELYNDWLLNNMLRSEISTLPGAPSAEAIEEVSNRARVLEVAHQNQLDRPLKKEGKRPAHIRRQDAYDWYESLSLYGNAWNAAPLSPSNRALLQANVEIETYTKLNQAVEMWVDRQFSLREWERVLRQNGVRIKREALVKIRETLRRGVTSAKQQDLEREYFDVIESVLENKEGLGTGERMTVDHAGEIAEAYHAPEKNEVLQPRINDSLQGTKLADAPSGISTPHAKKQQRRFIALYGLEHVMALRKQIWRLAEKNRQIWVDAGLITIGQAKYLANTYKNYVPLRRLELLELIGMSEAFKDGIKHLDMGKEGENVDKNLSDDFGAVKNALDYIVDQTGGGIDLRADEYQPSYGLPKRANANPLVLLMAQGNMALHRAERAEVGRAVLELVKQGRGSGFRNIATVVKKEQMTKLGFGKKGSKDEGKVTEVPDLAYLNRPEAIVVANKDGTREVILFNPEYRHIAVALKEGNMSHLSKAKSIQTSGKLLRFVAGMITRWNPLFAAPNLFRDVQSSYFNITAQYGTAVAQAMFNPLRLLNSFLIVRQANSLMRQRKYNPDSPEFKANEGLMQYEKYRAAGAPITFLDLGAQRGLNEFIQRVDNFNNPAVFGGLKFFAGGVTTFKEMIEVFNDSIENTTRFAFFQYGLEEGLTSTLMPGTQMDESELALGAKNLTVNFEQKGTMGGAMNALYMFSNANIQSTARMMDAIFTREGPAGTPLQIARDVKMRSTAKQAIGQVVAFNFMMSMFNSLYSGIDPDDDEEYYSKIPDYQKQSNIIVMNVSDQDGSGVMIPAPYGWNFFGAIGSMAGEMYAGKRTKSEAMAYLLETALNSFNPTGAPNEFADLWVPTVAKPPFELSRNRDWKGSAIYKNKYGDQTTPDSQLYFENVSPIARDLTTWMNEKAGGNRFESSGMWDINPHTLEHYATFLGGGIAKGLIRGLTSMGKAMRDEEVEAGQIPFARRFYFEESPYAGATMYRERIDRVIQAERMHEAGMHLDEVHKAVLRLHRPKMAIESRIKNLRQRMRKLPLEDPARKRLEEMEAELQNDFNRTWRTVMDAAGTQ